jgi:tetratricopeptide (TPR) repeat protein
MNLSLLSHVVAAVDDVPRAKLFYELLLPYGGRCVVAFTTVCLGSSSRPLGLLATTISHYEQAARHFEDALEMNARIRSPLWLAHTHHEYARMLLRHGRGDRQKALALLGEALATAEELGLPALADRAWALRQRARAPASA